MNKTLVFPKAPTHYHPRFLSEDGDETTHTPALTDGVSVNAPAHTHLFFDDPFR